MEAQLLHWKQAASCQHDEPSHKEPLEPGWLAIVRFGPHGRTALLVEASHFYQHDEPSHKEPLKRVWLARVQLGSSGRTALEVKASHFISTAKPQRSSETSLVGNSAAWTQQKHGSCSESRWILTNIMSQAARQQTTSETSLAGNSVAWTERKHSS